jgi:hypothetical protein
MTKFVLFFTLFRVEIEIEIEIEKCVNENLSAVFPAVPRRFLYYQPPRAPRDLRMRALVYKDGTRGPGVLWF